MSEKITTSYATARELLDQAFLTKDEVLWTRFVEAMATRGFSDIQEVKRVWDWYAQEHSNTLQRWSSVPGRIVKLNTKL